MRVLLDENVPRKLVELFEPSVEAITVAQRGWRGMANGELLEAAEKEFDALVTTDRGIPHQQDLSAVTLSVVLLETQSNRYEDLAPLMDRVNAVLREVQPGTLVHIAG
jgi:predicted nuclease of predicted toxin-antitoxin system